MAPFPPYTLPSLYRRVLPDGRLVGVNWYPAVPCCTPPAPLSGLWVGTRALIDDLWLYTGLLAAREAARTWDGQGEPSGWHLHPQSRRHRPGGDPARQDVAP